MKKYIITSILILFASGVFSQGIINNGAKIVVGSGSYVTISGTSGNLRNEITGSVDLSGTLNITGNVTNNVPGSDLMGTVTPGGVVVLGGSTSQILGGTTTVPFVFPNLTVNNPAGIVLSNNVQVNGNMTFSNGLVTIGSRNLIFGPLSQIVGTPSASRMIVATGSGQVQKVWTVAGNFTYPIGDANGTSKYSPVTLNFTTGTFAPGAITSMNVVNAKYPDPTITGSYLNRYWNLSQTGITGFNCDAIFQYLPSDVTGTESSISGLRVVPTPFSVYTPANTSLQQLHVSALTSFGTFTGGLYSPFKTLNLTSVMLEGLYNGGGLMRQAQGLLGAHSPAGVADTITVELHSSTLYATLIYSARVPLSITGSATVNVPATNNGSYYITIKHRNSLQTVSATAQSFAGNVINQSFALPANVFGGNLVQMTDLSYTIYGGDVNQDNIIDLSDSAPVDNQAAAFGSGYLPEDVNGDGLIDLSDASIIDNNVSLFVGAITP